MACESIPVINFTTFKIVSNFVDLDYLIYDCIPGYELIKGDRIRLCNLNGNWRGHNVECASKNVHFYPKFIYFFKTPHFYIKCNMYI